MRLLDVANVFNNLVCVDAYTGAFFTNGQLEPYDGNKRDGLMGDRRVFSFSPSDVIPFRRVIRADGNIYIIGKGSPDNFRGSMIRVAYIAQESNGLSQIRTIAEVCLDLPGFTAHIGQVWIKDLSNPSESSELISASAYHLASTEPIQENHLIMFKGRLQIVRAINFGAAGTLIANCDQLDVAAVEIAVLNTGVYNPVKDTSSNVSTIVTLVRMRWQSLFAYHNSTAPKFQPGDIQVAIAKSVATVTAGATLGLSDGTWRVESVVAEGLVWLCRATRQG